MDSKERILVGAWVTLLVATAVCLTSLSFAVPPGDPTSHAGAFAAHHGPAEPLAEPSATETLLGLPATSLTNLAERTR